MPPRTIGPGTLLCAATLVLCGSWAGAQPTVAIEVGGTAAATDDYLCWTPVSARARLVGGTSAQAVAIRSFPNATLFAATSDNKLWARDPVFRDVAWQEIGHANSVVAMAGLGGRLFAATGDDKLWTRAPKLADAPWQEIGHANDVVAMAALGDTLFAATSDNKLWARAPKLADTPWTEIGHADHVVAMAAAQGKLFAATSDNKLWARDPVLHDVAWTQIGAASNVAAMTASGGFLFAATHDNKLWVREAKTSSVAWTSIGHADNVVALAVTGPGGRLGFLPDPLPAPGAPLPVADSLNLSLPADGSWKSFYVVGRAASTEDKDTAVAAFASARELGRRPVMVRVRKNAESLTEGERERFLAAFAAAHGHQKFAKYWGIHTDAGNMSAAHDRAFLPWHRVLLLQIERELQAEDPSVALPYWEFDKPAPRLFTEEFLGRVDPGSSAATIVKFSPTNPLRTVTLSHPTMNVSPLVRLRNGDTSVSPALNKGFMSQSSHALMRASIWGPYHGMAHTYINGIVGDINRSPADPLFFLLHVNVDRAWAAWQRFYGRFDRTQANGYDPQGSHPATSPIPLGNFANDTMWPWDGLGRPGSTVMFTTLPVSLPPNAGPGTGVNGAPQVGEALDYLDLARAGKAQGFCYDSLPYGVGSVEPFWHP